MTYSVDIKASNQIDYTVQSATDYYPYGKALRSYGKERYQSTYHERDVESGFDYRGARFYDSDVARFNSLDPLAADYPEFSDYLYVAGNPLIFIDPNGKNTIYYDEDGNELFSSEDGLDNAVVIISNDNLHAFSERLLDRYSRTAQNGGDILDAIYDDSFNGTLRELGTNYIVDGMIELLEESIRTPAKKDRLYMKDGSKMGSERSAGLVQNGNVVSVDNSSPSHTNNQPDYVAMNGIHTHPNGYIKKGVMEVSGQSGAVDNPMDNFGGSPGAPPSPEDRTSYRTSGRKSRKVRDVTVSPTTIWIYNDNESQNVGAPIDFFKQN